MSGGAQTLINPVSAGASKGFRVLGDNKHISDLAAGGPYFAQADTGNGSSGSGATSVLQNLGPQSMVPQLALNGAFQPVQTSGSPFNAMAAQGAGSLFQPSMQASIPRIPAVPMTSQPGTKGGMTGTMSPALKKTIINRGVLK